VFGRSGTKDQTQSSAPTSSVCVGGNCQRATFQGTTPPSKPGAKSVQLPGTVSSTQLLTDAQNNGQVFTGTTTISLNGGSATISNCPGATNTAACTTGWLNKTVMGYPPIIYVGSASGCPSTYSPSAYTTNTSGQYFGPCGDVYVHGYYNQPLTIVSDHDIIVMTNTNGLTNPGVTTDTDSSGNPVGNATLGLVAGDFVRVMHSANQTPSPVTIDAAVLTLQHSFMVDNYTSGAINPQPYLTVHGALAQRYRGAVGQVGASGYLKNYNYDDRLHVLLPPYLFSLSTAGWDVSRETLCMSNPNLKSTDPTSCAYTGP
jgi:hypothetical protein